MTKAIGMIISLGFLSSLALAQARPDPLEACYQQPDGAPRLACFNKEMQRRQASDTSGNGAPAPATAASTSAARSVRETAAPAHRADDTVGLQGAELRRKLKADGVPAASVKPIVASVIRVVPRPHSLQAYVLDNGQAWEQVEYTDNLDVRPHDTVTIKPGMLGAFFLTAPRSQRVRVHRIL